MSDKGYDALSATDRIIRDTIAATRESGDMEGGELLRIAFIRGFELFNTRPYHNYESWGDGYRVSGRGVTVEREDLDDAIAAWSLAVWEAWTDV